MNKIGRLLLAAVMSAGAGWGCSFNESGSVHDIPGHYTLTQYYFPQGDGILGPPDYTGTATLTTDNRYSFDLSLAGATFRESGRFLVTTPWGVVTLNLYPDVGTSGITSCIWGEGAEGGALTVTSPIKSSPGTLRFVKR